MKLADIMAACGVSKSSGSGFRSGRHTPALKHWQALAKLAGIEAPPIEEVNPAVFDPPRRPD